MSSFVQVPAHHIRHRFGFTGPEPVASGFTHLLSEYSASNSALNISIFSTNRSALHTHRSCVCLSDRRRRRHQSSPLGILRLLNDMSNGATLFLFEFCVRLVIWLSKLLVLSCSMFPSLSGESFSFCFSFSDAGSTTVLRSAELIAALEARADDLDGFLVAVCPGMEPLTS